MMIKQQYLEETTLHHAMSTGSTGSDVKKVQEWLNLWRYVDPAWSETVITDGQFGLQTNRAVRLFQIRHHLPVDGIVGPETFAQLTSPMAKAFAPVDRPTSRERILACAEQHLANHPCELDKVNRGPWVRAYMDGHEGRDWPWCMGFVQTILDQAFAATGEKFTTFMPHSYSCDLVAQYGRRHNLLIPHSQLKADPAAYLGPGDLFLIRQGAGDWVHTGIVIGIGHNIVHTIEGNTNDEGSREGFEVCSRKRNLDTEVIDGFRLQP